MINEAVMQNSAVLQFIQNGMLTCMLFIWSDLAVWAFCSEGVFVWYGYDLIFSIWT